VIVLLVFLAWGATWYLLGDQSERGTFGDMFGAVNALYSGLAFSGVVYAILLQREEISMAKEELNRSKAIIERQQLQIDEQRADDRQKSFEDTFFRLLTLHNQVVDSMDYKEFENASEGRDVFLALRKNLLYSNDYSDFYQHYGFRLGHYFRLLYNILDYIKKSEPKNINLYAKLVRAQLSDAEVQILFYNSLSKEGAKMKPLVEYFSMLKHFSPTRNIENERQMARQYSPIAFNRDANWPNWIYSGDLVQPSDEVAQQP
jgi:hypothetical protein